MEMMNLDLIEMKCKEICLVIINNFSFVLENVGLLVINGVIKIFLSLILVKDLFEKVLVSLG